jgi:ribosomal protein S18 acetylase RimI-like enzyme
MNTVSTRLAALEDVPRVAPLFDAYRQFYKQPADPILAMRFLHDRMRREESLLLIAEADQEALGFCQLYPTFCSVQARPIMVLYDLFVAEDARGKGVGRALLTAAEALAVKRGVARLDLSTARKNFAAQALYEALGWKRDKLFYTYSKAVPASTST